MAGDRLKQVQLDSSELRQQLVSLLTEHKELKSVALALSLQSSTLIAEGNALKQEVETLVNTLQTAAGQYAGTRWLVQDPSEQEYTVYKSDKALQEAIPALTTTASGTVMLCALQIPFMPGSFVVAACLLTALNRTTKIMRSLGEDILRDVIGQFLQKGIQTDTSLPDSDREWQQIVDALKSVPENDLLPLLELGGFADRSLGESGEMEDGRVVLRCQECIYYLPRRKWCDLPELPLPVEPHWYCRLWKL